MCHISGIFISRVTPHGPADIAGLRKDDKVLSVNGYTCISVDHYEAVGILKAAGSHITMKIERDIVVPIKQTSIEPPARSAKRSYGVSRMKFLLCF